MEGAVLLVPVSFGEETRPVERLILEAARSMRSRKIHLLGTPEERERVEALHHVLATKTTVRTWIMHGPVWEDTFALLSKLVHEERDTIIVTSASSSDMTSAALAAATAHGRPALRAAETGVELIPIVPNNLYGRLGKSKLAILEMLSDERTYTVRELVSKIQMSATLVQHHLHGTATRPGLTALGFVMQPKRGSVKITTTGRMIARGMPDTPREAKDMRRKEGSQKEILA